MWYDYEWREQYKQQNAHQPTHADKLKLVYTWDRFNFEKQSYTNVYKTKPSRVYLCPSGDLIFLIDVFKKKTKKKQNNASDKLMDYT